jgi:cobalamin biosynthesis protein CobD/CbiB
LAKEAPKLEIRQNAARIPTRSIAFVFAALALLALAVTAWFVLRTSAPTPVSPTGHTTNAACAGLVNVALDRCEQANPADPQTTHGH